MNSDSDQPLSGRILPVLVTGTAGFIGSKVVEFLLAEGHRIFGLDNLNDAYDGRLKGWRLRQLEGRRRTFSGGFCSLALRCMRAAVFEAHRYEDCVRGAISRPDPVPET